MVIDYRYHLASIVAVFVSLLLGILIGIGLAPNPEVLGQVVSDLKRDYNATRKENAQELALTKAQRDDATKVAKALAATVISDRLQGKRVAIVLDHEFSRGFADDLRGWLAQAGAEVTSTTTITKHFIVMSESDRRNLSAQLNFYPPADTPFRSALARAVARALTSGRARIISGLESSGLVRLTADSAFVSRPDVILVVGGSQTAGEAAPEQIDAPLIDEVQRQGIRVVGCEASTAKVSAVAKYQACGATTVDNMDTPAGRLAVVLTLEGAEGHFGTKDSADQLFPEITATGG